MSTARENEEIDTNPSGDDTGSMNDAFLMIYRVMAILASVMFFGILVLSIIDILVYIFRELNQRFRVTIDPGFINAKSTDVQTLQYVKNNPNDEPYSIFLEQRLVMSIFIIVGSCITLLGLQMAIFFGMKLYFIVKKQEFKEKISVPMNYLGLLLLCYVGAAVLSGMYKGTFVKNTQVKMKNVRAQMATVRRFLYMNMINDADLLKALRQDDFDGVVSIMKKNRNNLTTLKKMMFTYNVYVFFSSQIPDSDPNYDLLMEMFSVDGMQKQKVDPTLLLQYKRPVFMPNLYPTIRDKLQKSMTKEAERAFLKDFGGIMKDLNKKLVRIQNISEGKKSVFTYLFKVFLVAVLMSCVIILMLIFIFLSKIFAKLSGFFLNLFGRQVPPSE
jgi:hypothetical protein